VEFVPSQWTIRWMLCCLIAARLTQLSVWLQRTGYYESLWHTVIESQQSRETLAYAALAQLIVSFFLVIVGVGVPVVTLVSLGQV
jgi:hypothetical protein